MLGVLPRVAANPLQAFAELSRRYGDLYRFDVGPVPVHVLTNPDHLKHVLATNNRNYWKGPVFERTRLLFGKGLVISEGEAWQRQRRIMAPSFQRERIAHLVSIMADEVRKRMRRFEQALGDGEPVDMQLQMMTITLNIVIKAMFSFSIDDDEVEEVANAFSVILKHIDLRFLTFFLPEWVPLPGRAEAQRALQTLDGVVRRVIEQRRREPGQHDDLLEALMQGRDADTGERMTDEQLRDETVTTFFGGYEATANALAWTWTLLAEHRDVAREVQRECLTHVPDDSSPSLDGLLALSYTEQVINESMRLYPPFWISFRTSYEEDTIGGYRIPPRAPLVLCHYLAHRHPDFWRDPESFDPDRFSPERTEQRPRHYLAPFGVGQRMCIGKHFAMLEMKLILSMVVRRYRLELVEGHPVEPFPRATLRSRDGIWMSVHQAEAMT
ncbi:MAG: cytochrome P450 [Myxococcales bacterium]|nr:cytochrome P450 [Myxococcales bacterium]